MKKLGGLVMVALFLASSVGFAWNGELEDDEKWTNKKVMGAMFKGPKALKKKLDAGTATDEDKKQVLKLMKALAKNKAKKGEAESWKTKTAALVKAAESMVKGDADAPGAFKKAANCKACHKLHK